jgi:acetyl esterase/lipase
MGISYLQYLIGPNREVPHLQTGRLQIPLDLLDTRSSQEAVSFYVKACNLIRQDKDFPTVKKSLDRAAVLWESDNAPQKAAWARFLSGELTDRPEHLASSILLAGRVLYFRSVSSSGITVQKDISYDKTPCSNPAKHRLDLFLPAKAGFATVIFFHGGGLTFGDKDQTFGPADVYANFGRYLATRGIGAAVVNYRLIPEVSWNEQLTDVGRSVAWVQRNIKTYGGKPDALFLSGYSAGGQLASRVALDPKIWWSCEVDIGLIRGVMIVSGSGLNLVDQRIYELEPGYLPSFAERFASNNSVEEWQKNASPALLVKPDALPFLILSGDKEPASLQEHSRSMERALTNAGNKFVSTVIPGLSHGPMILALSNDGKSGGPAMIEFVRTH